MLPTSRAIIHGHEFVAQLTEYVRRHEAAIQAGDIKFTLQPQSLQYLCSKFPPPAIDHTASQTKRGSPAAKREKLRHDVFYLYSFCQSLLTLKITSPGRRMVTEGSLQLGHFANLTTLEINKVHVKVLQGLDLLQRQLVRLSCHNSLYNFSDLFMDVTRSIHANRQTATSTQRPPEWTRLKQIDCSHNFADQLDESFLYLTEVEMLDVSFNRLTRVNNLQNLPKLQYLNLGFNMITSMEDCALVIGNVSTLVLRNNQLNSVKGLERLMGLERLDLRDNCLWDLKDLKTLASLPFLSSVWLQSNPVSYSHIYRVTVFSYFNGHRRTILLDGVKPNLTEQLLIEATTDQIMSQRAEPTLVMDTIAHATPAIAIKRKKNVRKEVVIEDIDAEGYDEDATSLDERLMAVPASLEAAAARFMLQSGQPQTPRARPAIEATENLTSLPDNSYSGSPKPNLTVDTSAILANASDIIEPVSPTSHPSLFKTSSPQVLVSSPSSFRSPVASPMYSSPRVPRANPRLKPTSNMSMTSSPLTGSTLVADDDDTMAFPGIGEFRHRIESMRRDAGENWLKVLTEMQDPSADLLPHESDEGRRKSKHMKKSATTAELAQAESCTANGSRDDHFGAKDTTSLLGTSLPAHVVNRHLVDDQRIAKGRPTAYDDNMFSFPGNARVISDSHNVPNYTGPLTRSNESPDSLPAVSTGVTEVLSEDLLLRCQICGDQVTIETLMEHSQECALRSQAPLAAKYYCMLCTRTITPPAGSVDLSKVMCPHCKSLYVAVLVADKRTALPMSSAIDRSVRRQKPTMLGIDALSLTGPGVQYEIETEALLADPPLTLHNNMLLFMDIKVFQREDEKMVAFVRSGFISSKNAREHSAYLLLSNRHLYCLVRKNPPTPMSEIEPEKTIRMAHFHSLDTIARVDVGLRQQYLVISFNSSALFEATRYMYILRDETLVGELLKRIMDQLRPTKPLTQLVYRDHTALLNNVRTQVLSGTDSMRSLPSPDAALRAYALCFHMDTSPRPVSVIVTSYGIYLCEERLSGAMEDGTKFVVKDSYRVSDVASVDISTQGFHAARIHYELESADSQATTGMDDGTSGTSFSSHKTWDLIFVSSRARDDLIQTISEEWRAQYKIDLLVTQSLVL